ncbi:MAG: hypothetical protein GC162_11135 [Planctomycetes bacterium]|nr:hypothetical protein [Planctomycetota bacterium]
MRIVVLILVYLAAMTLVLIMPRVYHQKLVTSVYLTDDGDGVCKVLAGHNAASGSGSDELVDRIAAYANFPGNEDQAVVRKPDGKYVFIEHTHNLFAESQTFDTMDLLKLGHADKAWDALAWKTPSFWKAPEGYKRMAIAGGVTVVMVFILASMLGSKGAADAAGPPGR